MCADTDRRRRDDAMMRAAHDEYMAWLAEQETFEDPDDPTDSDRPVCTGNLAGLLTPEEYFWLTEEELFRQERAALRADLYMF